MFHTRIMRQCSLTAARIPQPRLPPPRPLSSPCDAGTNNAPYLNAAMTLFSGLSIHLADARCAATCNPRVPRRRRIRRPHTVSARAPEEGSEWESRHRSTGRDGYAATAALPSRLDLPSSHTPTTTTTITTRLWQRLHRRAEAHELRIVIQELRRQDAELIEEVPPVG